MFLSQNQRRTVPCSLAALASAVYLCGLTTPNWAQTCFPGRDITHTLSGIPWKRAATALSILFCVAFLGTACGDGTLKYLKQSWPLYGETRTWDSANRTLADGYFMDADHFLLRGWLSGVPSILHFRSIVAAFYAGFFSYPTARPRLAYDLRTLQGAANDTRLTYERLGVTWLSTATWRNKLCCGAVFFLSSPTGI